MVNGMKKIKFPQSLLKVKNIKSLFMKTSTNKRFTINHLQFTIYYLPFAFLLFTFYFCLCLPVFAQQKEDDPPANVAVPPTKFLSQDEKKLLEAEKDTKKRTKLSLEFMEARIIKSEKLLVEDNFKDSLNELGGFHAVLDNALSYLVKHNDGSNKVDNNFKNFEIYLRKQVPRLETIRREMPIKYGYYVGKLMRAVREARAKAVEPLFDDTVVPNKP